MRYVIGVDGGGTGTRAVILDERGAELGRAERPGRVATLGSPADAARSVVEAVRAATSQVGLELPGELLWAGLAGAGTDAVRRALTEAIALAGLASRVRVGTDAEVAFHAAFADGPGILLIAGTGSIAWGRGPDGRRTRVGGWGERLGDEGSGYAIGRAALRSVLRAQDGRGQPTRLTSAIVERCGVVEPHGLVGWVESAPKADVAALVPTVVDVAAQLDAVAEAILEEAVSELVAHVGALLGATGPWDGPAPMVLWGGLLGEGGPLRSATISALADYPVSVLDTAPDPPAGAAQLALDELRSTD